MEIQVHEAEIVSTSPDQLILPSTTYAPASNIKVDVKGNVTGQLVAGNYNLVIGSIHGDQVTIIGPGQQPLTRPRQTPVFLRPRPFPGLLDRVEDMRTIASAAESALPVQVYGLSGIGKTSLLRHLAHRQVEDIFPDGVLYFVVGRQAIEDLLQSFYEAFYEC